jgi:predicted DNA-binding protein
MAVKALSITVDEAIAEKLKRLSEETQRTRSYFVNQALREYFEELEDLELALQRRDGGSTPIGKVKKELGL